MIRREFRVVPEDGTFIARRILHGGGKRERVQPIDWARPCATEEEAHKSIVAWSCGDQPAHGESADGLA